MEPVALSSDTAITATRRIPVILTNHFFTFFSVYIF